MKKRIFIAIIMIFTIVLFITACTSGTSNLERWEYKAFTFNADYNPEYDVEHFEKELNELGADGWEYAFELQGFGTIFKRKIP